MERRRQAGVRRDDVVEDEVQPFRVREPLDARLTERFPGKDAGPVMGEGDIDLPVRVRACRCAEDTLGERAH